MCLCVGEREMMYTIIGLSGVCDVGDGSYDVTGVRVLIPVSAVFWRESA